MTGTTDAHSISDIREFAHRIISKPSDTEEIRDTVLRLCNIQESLPNMKLRRQIIGQCFIPSKPNIYLELTQTTEDHMSSIETIALVVAKDVSLVSKIMQLANSSYYGYARKVSDLSDAIKILGLETIQGIALSFGTFSQFQDKISLQKIQTITDQSVQVAKMAVAVARKLPLSDHLRQLAFVAGLLHACGKLVLMQIGDEHEYETICEAAEQCSMPEWEAEEFTWGMSHAEVGAYILDLWGLPLSLVESVLFHHAPAKSSHPDENAACLVHIAEALVKLRLTKNHEQFTAEVDATLIDRLGWKKHIETLKLAVLENTNEVTNR